VPVTTGPQDPDAAGRDRLRAGHADREQAIETLKDAFIHGRLTRDELDTRAGQALTARTHADLAVLTADLPPGRPAPPAWAAPPAARPARPPAVARRRRPLVKAAAGSGSCLIVMAAAMRLHAIVDPGNTLTPYDAWATPLFFIAVFSVLTALGFLAYGVVASVEQGRARGQLPPPPGPGGRAGRAGDRRGSDGPDPAPADRRPGQGHADLRARKPRRHQHIPVRAGQPRAGQPAPGAA
jgi:hypothetical protein